LLLETQVNGIHSKPSGEKAWPALIMFKALLLQSWNSLSDPQLKKQLDWDLSFRRLAAFDISTECTASQHAVALSPKICNDFLCRKIGMTIKFMAVLAIFNALPSSSVCCRCTHKIAVNYYHMEIK
jgi:hypothetical protein